MSDIEDMQKENDIDHSEPVIEEEVFDKDDWYFDEDDLNDTCDDDDDEEEEEDDYNYDDDNKLCSRNVVR